MSIEDRNRVLHMMHREGIRFNIYQAPEMVLYNTYHMFSCCETIKEAQTVRNVLLSMDEPEKKVLTAMKLYTPSHINVNQYKCMQNFVFYKDIVANNKEDVIKELLVRGKHTFEDCMTKYEVKTIAYDLLRLARTREEVEVCRRILLTMGTIELFLEEFIQLNIAPSIWPRAMNKSKSETDSSNGESISSSRS